MSQCFSYKLFYRYEEYLNAESQVNRVANQPDTRVHCCLYFVAPSGHGLKPLDVEFMQRLHDKVNIIPESKHYSSNSQSGHHNT